MARTSSVTVRAATVADIPAIVAMGQRFHSLTTYGVVVPLDEPSVARRLREEIQGEGVVFIAEAGGPPLGMLGATIAEPWFGPQKFVLELFWWVEAFARGTGAGLALLDAIEAWWPSRATALLMLRTPNLKPEAMDRLYRMRGYRPWEQMYLKTRS